MEHQHELFTGHGVLRPDVVCRENAELLHRDPLEIIFNIFGINIFPFRGDDHVFLAPEKLQMARGIDAAEVAGHEPAIHDGFRRHFRIVQISRTSRSCCARPLRRFRPRPAPDANFHPAHGFADGVGPEGLEIVQRDRGARFRATVAVVNRNADVVEKLNRGRFGKRAADEQRLSPPPKAL